jgi:hypothetical protein
MENKRNITNATTVAADFDTNYSSPAVAPAKKLHFFNEIR